MISESIFVRLLMLGLTECRCGIFLEIRAEIAGMKRFVAIVRKEQVQQFKTYFKNIGFDNQKFSIFIFIMMTLMFLMRLVLMNQQFWINFPNTTVQWHPLRNTLSHACKRLISSANLSRTTRKLNYCLCSRLLFVKKKHLHVVFLVSFLLIRNDLLKDQQHHTIMNVNWRINFTWFLGACIAYWCYNTKGFCSCKYNSLRHIQSGNHKQPLTISLLNLVSFKSLITGLPDIGRRLLDI